MLHRNGRVFHLSLFRCSLPTAKQRHDSGQQDDAIDEAKALRGKVDAMKHKVKMSFKDGRTPEEDDCAPVVEAVNDVLEFIENHKHGKDAVPAADPSGSRKKRCNRKSADLCGAWRRALLHDFTGFKDPSRPNLRGCP